MIGNPPYGAKLSREYKRLYKEIYSECQFKIDTYSLFLLLSLNLLSKGGVCYYIIPNTLLDNYFEEAVRKRLLENSILEIFDLSDKIFDAAVVHSMIFGYAKNSLLDHQIKIGLSDDLIGRQEQVPQSFFNVSST